MKRATCVILENGKPCGGKFFSVAAGLTVCSKHYMRYSRYKSFATTHELPQSATMQTNTRTHKMVHAALAAEAKAHDESMFVFIRRHVMDQWFLARFPNQREELRHAYGEDYRFVDEEGSTKNDNVDAPA